MMKRLRRKRGDLPTLSLSSSLPSSLSSLISPPHRGKRQRLDSSSNSNSSQTVPSSPRFYVPVEEVALCHTVPAKLDWVLEQLLLDDEDNDDEDVFENGAFADNDLGADSGLEFTYHQYFHHYVGEEYKSDTSYEHACGGQGVGSGASTPASAAAALPRSDDPVTQPTPSRLQSFFSKHTLRSTRLKRTKSVTRLERCKRLNSSASNNNLNTINCQSTVTTGNDGDSNADVVPSWHLGPTTSRIHASRSYESLLSANTVVNSLDLAHGEVTINPLHFSILGQENCFQVTSPQGTRFFSCRSFDECERWVDSLRRAVGRTCQQQMRIDNELKMFILEAKGLALKKRYFCEILLDGSLHGRTSTKSKTNICFWGEHFDFFRLPPTKNVTIALYRESEKKRRKEKSILIGFVMIPVSEISSRCYTEKWYPVQTESNKSLLKDPIALRIKCKFQTLEILSMEMYNSLLQFMTVNYKALVLVLEPTLNVKTKEDIATTFVNIMQSTGNASTFLIDIVTNEIERIGNASLLLRGNSVASKAMETYMKLVGDKYLRETLTQLVNTLVKDGMDCEVDPMKIKEISSLVKQQKNLLSVVKMAWSCILNSSTNFPQDLRKCFSLYRERFTHQGKADLINNLISSSIFLRFLCPAIMSPSLFNIIREYPDERASRNLTLVAKTLQTLANFTKFQGKENYMEFMNDFIESEQDQMRSFLFKISSPTDGQNDVQGTMFEGEIDLGKQLSILHILLTEALDNISSNNVSNGNRPLLDSLHRILEEISIAKKQSNINTAVKHAASTPTIHAASMSVLQNNNNTLSMQRCDDSNSLFSDEGLNYQSLQRITTSPTSLPSISSTPNTNRSSTLPRNSFLMGSAKKAAINLHTADDYVLYSALEKELPNAGDSIGYHHIQSNRTTGPSWSWSNWSNGPTWSTPNNKIISTSHSHHHHFHNHYGNLAYKNKFGNTTESQTKCDKAEESPSLSPDEVEDTESSNDQFSSSSLSLLSNVASSGYQSFGYSQSSSPVDPSIAQHEILGNNVMVSNATHSSPQLNPTYLKHRRQIENQNKYHSSQTSSPETNFQQVSTAGCTPHQHYHPLRKLSLTNPIPATLTPFSSVEDLSTNSLGHGQGLNSVSLDPSSLGSLLSPIQQPPMSHSSSSEDIFHPDFRSRLHAPRTNPRCLPTGRGCSTAGWGTSPMPGHHHSASDLSTNLAWRGKMSRSQSSFKRSHDWRSHCESDSSDCEASFAHPSFSIHQNNQNDSWHNTSQQPRTENQRKSLKEYEKEITRMRTAMEEMKHKLLSSSEPENSSNTDISIANHQEKQQKQQNENIFNEEAKSEKDNTLTAIPSMKDLLQKLLILQEEFKSEKTKMQEALVAKDVTISEQEKRITALDRTNNQLIKALTRVKELKHSHSEELDTEKCQELQPVTFSDKSSS